jgi:hypothetical protein
MRGGEIDDSVDRVELIRAKRRAVRIFACSDYSRVMSVLGGNFCHERSRLAPA